MATRWWVASAVPHPLETWDEMLGWPPPPPSNNSLAKGGKRVESTPTLISVDISCSIDGVGGRPLRVLRQLEDKLTSWPLGRPVNSCRSIHIHCPPLVFPLHAGLLQVSPSCLGVTAGSHPGQVGSLSHGPERQTAICAHAHAHALAPTAVEKFAWFVFWWNLLFLTKCDNLMRTHCRAQLNFLIIFG